MRIGKRVRTWCTWLDDVPAAEGICFSLQLADLPSEIVVLPVCVLTFAVMSRQGTENWLVCCYYYTEWGMKEKFGGWSTGEPKGQWARWWWAETSCWWLVIMISTAYWYLQLWNWKWLCLMLSFLSWAHCLFLCPLSSAWRMIIMIHPTLAGFNHLPRHIQLTSQSCHDRPYGNWTARFRRRAWHSVEGRRFVMISWIQLWLQSTINSGHRLL